MSWLQEEGEGYFYNLMIKYLWACKDSDLPKCFFRGMALLSPHPHVYFHPLQKYFQYFLEALDPFNHVSSAFLLSDTERKSMEGAVGGIPVFQMGQGWHIIVFGGAGL